MSRKVMHVIFLAPMSREEMYCKGKAEWSDLVDDACENVNERVRVCLWKRNGVCVCVRCV